MIYKAQCDFCGKTRYVTSSVIGCYCADCYNLLIEECSNAYDEIEEFCEEKLEEEKRR